MAFQPPQYGQTPGNPQQQFYQQQPFPQNGYPQPDGGAPKPTGSVPFAQPPNPQQFPQVPQNVNGSYQNGATNGNQNYHSQAPGSQQFAPPAPNPLAPPFQAPNSFQQTPQQPSFPSKAPTPAPFQQGNLPNPAGPGPNQFNQAPSVTPPQFQPTPQSTAQVSRAPSVTPQQFQGNPPPQQQPFGGSQSQGGSIGSTQPAPSNFPPGPVGQGGPSSLPPGPLGQENFQQAPGTAQTQPNFQPGSRAPGSFNPGQVGSPGFPPGAPQSATNFPPRLGGPSNFPPGPGGPQPPTGFPPGPGQPSNFPPGPGGPQPPTGFPPGPGGPSSFPPGPGGPQPSTGFPPGPGQLSNFPPGPGGPQKPTGFPPGPGGPSNFPPGPGGPQPPTGFPPGPGGPSNFPPGPGGPQAPGFQFQQPGGFPGMQGGPPQQRQQRLDPNMMPSAVQVMDDDTTRAGLFPTGFPHAELPPLVSTSIYAQDQGNCNPKYMRSTIYMAPQLSDMLKATNLPFSVVISPFAALNELEREPPVVDLGPQGPIRCQRCKAYICPFMEFQDGGRRFKCPFCHASTPVEDAYFAHLDHTGRRTDIEMRPELFLGAFDLVATKQYCKNGVPPKEPAFIFMIDVSYNAMSNGMVPLLCQNLEKVLANLPRETGQLDSSIRVGLATFDQAVHFFDLSSATPKMLVMTDVQEPFVPLVEGLLLPYTEALPGLRAALAEIPKIFAPSRTTETILQPVVRAGLDALKCADRAGKLIIFSTVLPTFEAPGKLKTKNERSLLGTDKEKTALVTSDESYTKLGEQCVKTGVTVDLFLFPNSFIDVATIGQMSSVTGGSIFKFQYFSGDKDGVRMLNELESHISKKIAFDCMARVRTSTGIRPITFMGSFYMDNATDLELASIDESKAIVTEIKHDDKLTDQSAFIQTAVLYTSMTGQRRLRILNLCLPVSADYNQLFRVADSESLTAYMFKQAVQMNKDKGNKEMREQLSQRCAQFLAAYREKCSESAPLGQLILPESLKLMPLYVNSILKNDAVSGGSEMTVDDKVWQMELINGIRTEDAMALIYPRVLPVSDIELPESGELKVLPKPVRASSEYLDNSKAYLIDNGVVLFLWIGLGVPQQWVQDVFGVGAVTLIDAETGIIPEKDNTRSRALRRVINLLPRGIRQRKTFVIVEKSGLEPWMKKFLVEDKSSPTSMSYVDFLCHVHREIRNIIS